MVIRITAIFSIPAGMGMAALAQPITHLIFGNRDSSPITARILFLMGIGAIFASLSTPVNSMLQAVGRTDLPVKLLAVGLIIKITLNYFLVGVPEINVLGAGAELWHVMFSSPYLRCSFCAGLHMSYQIFYPFSESRLSPPESVLP